MQTRTLRCRWLCPALSIALLIATAACSAHAIAATAQDRITIVNRTNTAIIFRILTSDEAIRAYIGDTLHLRTTPPRATELLRPHMTTVVPTDSVEGAYRAGDSVVFYLFEVVGDLAVRRDMFALTPVELDRRGFRIEITRLPMNPARSSPPSR